MRKPKKETPLRQVRVASGQSQKQFAACLGLGLDLYHSLELGRARLTKENADSIAIKTGVTPESLDPKSSKLAFDTDGKPYTEYSWEAWQYGRWAGPWAPVEDFIQWVKFLCKIAERNGKLTELCFELCDCLTKARDKFDLRSDVNRELQRTKTPIGILATYGELRANQNLAKRVGFKDTDRTKPDKERWCETISEIPSWSPHSIFPMELAKRFQNFREPALPEGVIEVTS